MEKWEKLDKYREILFDPIFERHAINVADI